MSLAPKALFFDVFGTLVDWRASIARHSEAILGPLGLALAWDEFALAWRDQYQPSLEEVRSGRCAFAKLDVLHRRNLQRVLSDFAIEGIDERTVRDLTLAWHRIDAWPDVDSGLRQLKRDFLLAPVSNGNIAMMVALARHNGWCWDAVLGAELAGDYKPKPRVYLAAADALELRPDQCMMVAAHSSDLAAAAACGLLTAHIARPNEYGPGRGEIAPAVAVNVAANSLEDLAVKLAVGSHSSQERQQP
jgi:2-haloacid dehalogenase